MPLQDTSVALSAAPVKLLYTIEEAANTLSLSRRTFYNLITQGTVYTVKIGRSRRVPMIALQKYVEQLMQVN